MEAKIENAKVLIRKIMDTYQKPICMSSFGKDSQVLLHLLKTMGIKLPLLFHREAFCPEKYEFANRIILEEGYTAYDYPPGFTMLDKGPAGDFEVINHYQVGKNSTIRLGTGIKEPVEGKPFLCGLEDLYNKPTGGFRFKWDVCLVGHKSSDIDPLMGPIPLRCDINKVSNGPDYAYPLRHFTDEDIWAYTEKHGVPFNDKRYNRDDGYKEFSDITYNPDYFHTCMRCIDKDSPAEVYCPKYKKTLVNISNTVDYEPVVKLDYIG